MMRLNFSKRRVIQAAAAIACASALAASAAAGHTAYTYAPAASTAKAVEVGSYASAGATSLMSTLENAAYQEALTHNPFQSEFNAFEILYYLIRCPLVRNFSPSFITITRLSSKYLPLALADLAWSEIIMSLIPVGWFSLLCRITL